MCGRATLTVDVDEIAEVLGTPPVEIGPPKYNVAPTQRILVVRQRPHHEREMVFVRWGLIPWWAKPEEAKKIGARCVQARAETVARSPAFRDAFRSRRCLVIVDGFYEWATLTGGRGRRPHHVRREDRKPFAIGGVWEEWRAPDGAIVDSCAVVTTSARGPIAALHHRMPLVLRPEAYERWLHGPPDQASTVDADAGALVVVQVSRWVNDVRHDDPQCLAPEVASPIADPPSTG